MRSSGLKRAVEICLAQLTCSHPSWSERVAVWDGEAISCVEPDGERQIETKVHVRAALQALMRGSLSSIHMESAAKVMLFLVHLLEM